MYVVLLLSPTNPLHIYRVKDLPQMQQILCVIKLIIIDFYVDPSLLPLFQAFHVAQYILVWAFGNVAQC